MNQIKAGTRIFSPVMVARLSVTIGRHLNESKRLKALYNCRFTDSNRFEQMVLAKLWQSWFQCFGYLPPRSVWSKGFERERFSRFRQLKRKLIGCGLNDFYMPIDCRA